MNIRTSCDRCLFNNENTVCDASKGRVLDNAKFFVSGFCNIKRISGEKDIKKILDKEEKLSIILLAKDRPICQSIDFVNLYYDYIDEIIVITYLNDKDSIKRITKTLQSREIDKKSKNKQLYWTIESIYNKEKIEYQDHTLVDYVINKLKNNWFCILDTNDIVKFKHIRKFKDIINKNQENFICFYFDESDDLRIITNKFAFQQLKGNQERPFFLKLKQFEDWKDKCLKI